MAKTRTVQEELNTLKDDVQSLGADIASLLSSAKAEGAEKWDDVKGKVVDDMKKQLENLRERWSHARDLGEDKVESVKKQVEERPLVSVLIAFVVGIVIGKFIRR